MSLLKNQNNDGDEFVDEEANFEDLNESFKNLEIP